MKRILIVEDEPKINQLVATSLSLVGYQCFQAFYGMEALRILQQEKVDLILLDVQLPDSDGFDLIAEMKNVPVIFLTARVGIEDRVKGLNLGAEDYLIKPFAIDELLARVQVVLRRFNKDETLFCWKELTVNFATRQVCLREQEVELTPQEFSLLEVLIRHKNMALSREQLLEQAWGFDYEGDIRTVDVHVQRLRKKLTIGNELKTIFKLGYRLEVD